MTRRRRIIFAGTYERDYPRNRQMIRLLEAVGCEVEELHWPFWERMRDKSRMSSGFLGLATLALSLAGIYLALMPLLLSRLRHADAVAFGYIGQLDMLLLGSVARLVGKPVLFSPLVTFTDTLVEDRQLIEAGSPVARVVGAIDALSLRLASIVMVDTYENGAYLRERFSVPENKIIQIHVGADESVFRVPESARSTKRSGDRVHVLFYGKMIPLHGIDTILDAIEILEGDDRFTFEIIGSGQMEGLVHQFATRSCPERFVYRPLVAYRRLPNRIAMADCVLGIFGTGQKAGRVVPNKVFQAMAMGAPIITRESPAIRGVLEDDISALLVPPGDSEALAEALRRMTDPEFRCWLGHNARRAFERTGSDAVLAETMQRAIDELLSAPVSQRQGTG